MNTDDSHQMQDVALAIVAVVIAAIVGIFLAEVSPYIAEVAHWTAWRFL